MTDGAAKQAESNLRQIIADTPENTQAHIDLATLLLQRAELDEATLDEASRLAHQAVVQAPRRAETQLLLATVLREMGRTEDAAACLRTAAQIEPSSVIVLLSLAHTEMTLGHAEAADAVLDRLLQLQPDPRHGQVVQVIQAYAARLMEFAFTADQMHYFDEAIANYETAVAQNPGYAFALSRLLTIDGIAGNLATAGLRHKLLIASLLHTDMRSAVWQDLAVMAYQAVIRPLPRAIYKAVTGTIDRQLAELARGQERRPQKAGSSKSGRLKIGYLSTFFRDHPIGHVTAALFAAHDRARFDVHVFYVPGGPSSDYNRLIADGAEHFVELQGTHVEMADAIAAYALDILIYLDGYMTLSLLPAVALRPAPIQVFWLGHAGNCELSSIDYVIADATVIPPTEDGDYTAKVVRLPDVYHCASPHAVGPTMTRAEAGLPESSFVYCAFNNPEKIDRRIFATWMNILRRTEGSVLWLSRTHNPAIADNLRTAATNHGVDGSRLIFAARLPDKSAHLARHRLAGLFLDTPLHCASTTALDALWAGLPLLTVNGARPSARIAASFLRAIGLEDMICSSLAAYEERAVFFATDPDALADVRQRLNANRETYPLFQIGTFCRNLERVLEQIHSDHAR